MRLPIRNFGFVEDSCAEARMKTPTPTRTGGGSGCALDDIDDDYVELMECNADDQSGESRRSLLKVVPEVWCCGDFNFGRSEQKLKAGKDAPYMMFR